jgi:carbamoyl-phosphate synthase large subunit
VLAVGGNVSHGILKALARATLPCRVIGADIQPLKCGLYGVDKAVLSPWGSDPAFMDWLLDLCRRESVHAILSGAEPILPILSREADRIRSETGAICIVSDPATLDIGDDKLLTCQWLERHGLPCPDYAVSDDRDAALALRDRCGYPIVAKPRRGGGMRGMVFARDDIDFEYVLKRPGFLLQQYIGSDEDEYTAGTFADRDGRVRGCITLRRELHTGTTACAVAGAYPEVTDMTVRITELLRPMGPCNVQLRMHNGVAYCIEMNIRFSGTTPVRAAFGFNEVEESLRHYVLGEPARDLPAVHEGVMLRYWNELYVAPEAVEEIRANNEAENPGRWPHHIEDYGK